MERVAVDLGDADVAEHGPPRRPERLVDDRRVAAGEANVRRSLQKAGHPADLVRVPAVVLIAEEDDVAGGELDAAREVAGDAAAIDVHFNSNVRRRRSNAMGVRDRDRVVGGSIVEDYDLVRRPDLVDDASELHVEMPAAVVGRQDDGDRQMWSRRR